MKVVFVILSSGFCYAVRLVCCVALQKITQLYTIHIHSMQNIPDQIPIRCFSSPNDISVHQILSNCGVMMQITMGFARYAGALRPVRVVVGIFGVNETLKSERL